MSLPWSIFCTNYCLLTDQAVLNFASPDIGVFSWIRGRQLINFLCFTKIPCILKQYNLKLLITTMHVSLKGDITSN
jgi:hypothetical protein